jgi:hypothetical protein
VAIEAELFKGPRSEGGSDFAIGALRRKNLPTQHRTKLNSAIKLWVVVFALRQFAA